MFLSSKCFIRGSCVLNIFITLPYRSIFIYAKYFILIRINRNTKVLYCMYQQARGGEIAQLVRAWVGDPGTMVWNHSHCYNI